jgi:HEAT repeat protein
MAQTTRLQTGWVLAALCLCVGLLSTTAGAANRNGPSIPPLAVHRLIAELENADPIARGRAARLLGEVPAAAAFTVPHLTRMLDDPEIYVRWSALQALHALVAEAAPPAAALTQLLSDAYGPNRRMAAWTLGAMGAAARDAVPGLIDALADNDPGLRAACAWALGRMGPHAADAVATLTLALQDTDRDVRHRAIVALGKIGPQAATALAALKRTRYAADTYTRDLSAWAIARVRGVSAQLSSEFGGRGKTSPFAAVPYRPIGPQVPMVQSLKGTDAIDYGIAIRNLRRQPYLDAKTKEILIAASKNPDPYVRLQAVKALYRHRSVRAVPTLVEALHDEYHDIRRSAANALALLGPAAQPAVPALVDLLHDPNPDVAERALTALASSEIHVDAAVLPALIDNLRREQFVINGTDIDIWRRQQFVKYTAWIIARMGPSALQAVPFLVKLQLSGYKAGGGEVALALGRIGEAAVPPLSAELTRSYPKGYSTIGAESAIAALQEIGPPAVPALAQALAHAHRVVRSKAAHALGRLGPDAAPAVPSLVALLRDEDQWVRYHTAQTLGLIGPEGQAAASALGDTLRTDKDSSVRREAARALGSIGPAAVPVLIAALQQQTQDGTESTSVIRALGRIGPGAAGAVPLLIDRLDRPDSTNVEKYQIARALGHIGRPAAPAAPHLEALRDHESRQVRNAARDALDRIEAGGLATPP